MTIIEEIDALKQKISLRDWLLIELKKMDMALACRLVLPW